MKAEITIKEGNKRPVNPLIFGHFIEYMRDCIDEGMWAQLLKNRSFEISEHVKDGVPDFWHRTGVKDAFHFEQDWDHTISREGCSLKITDRNHYDGYAGTAQTGLCIQNGRYEGYVWMKSEQEVPVSIEIYDKEGREFLSKTISVNGEWKKYCFDFRSAAVTYTGTMEIRLKAAGTLWVDGCSLMPSDTVDGIWREVFERIKNISPAVIRFPGGCFADCYHWEDGIGERDTRPVRKNEHWGGYEDNSFGMDEYMEFCRKIGCEPMICVNFGSGTAEEAANWVEYCNGLADTPYGRLRAAHGHPEPWNIKYWDIGNETFGDWEIGHLDASGYAVKYLSFYEAMKEKDPTITFMVCGGDGDSISQEWNRKISEIIGDKMDVVCLHMYSQKEIQGEHDSRDIYYATAGSVKKYEGILNDSWETIRKSGNPAAMAAVTEYNVGTIIDSYREQTLEAAIFNAGMLNMFLRNTDKLAMCNLSDLVNGWPGGCIVSKDGHAFGTATYHVMSMYSGSRLKEVLDIDVFSPTYSTSEQIGNIEPLSGVPYVDAAACLDENGNTVIFALNRSCDQEAVLEIKYETPNKTVKKAEITTITSEKTSDMNTLPDESIVPAACMMQTQSGSVTLAKHSINRIVLLP